MSYSYTLPDNRLLYDGLPFECDGVAYPPNWLSLASAEDLTARGITKEPIPPPSVTDMKDELKRRVDDDAERVRLRYITPGVGMAMTYQEKKDQAVAVIAMGQASANALANNGAAEFPTLSASVPIEAANLYAAAQLVIARYEAWAALSRLIESARLSGKKAISDASDAAAARAAYEAITWPTN
jgi:hypothetical protein